MKRKDLGHLLPFCIFLAFLTGIVIGKFIPLFWMLLIGGILFSILSIFFYRKEKLFLSDIFIMVFFIFLGGLWIIPSLKQDINSFLGKKAEVKLKVISLPQEGSSRNICYANIRKINSSHFNRKIKVMDYTRSLSYLYSYQVQGKVSKRRYGGRDFYTLWIKKDTKVKELPLPFWDKYICSATGYLLSVFKNNLNEQGYRFMASVFMGRRELLGGKREIFSNAGVSHLLAISGLHIGMVSLFLFFILRFFNLSFRVSFIISLVFLYLYTFIIGASPSVLRAVIMYSTFVFSFLVKRKSKILNSLALAGIIILLWRPLMLFSIGFQLSFIAVFAIITGFKIFNIKAVSNVALNYLKQIFFCSLFVTLFLTPTVSYYFGKVYILSIFYNVVLIPLFTFILAVNFLLIIFSPILAVAQSLGFGLSLLVSGFLSLVQFFSSIKFSFVFYTFSAWGLVVYYFILAAVLLFFSLKRVKYSL